MIHCIGDSHVYVFSGVDSIGAKDILPFFKTYRLGPHTAYNIMKRRGLIEQIIRDEVKPGDMIMFCFGEIDCRVHLLKQSEQQHKPLAAVVSDCVERYTEVFRIARQYGFPILAWNVPPSSREDVVFGEYSTYGSCKQRNEVSRLFNELLRKKCEKEGVVFISIFDALLDRDGLTNTAYFLDSIHLSQKVMPLIKGALRDQGIDVERTQAHDHKRTLIYCGINNLVNFSKLRPDFDVCYGFDANPDKVELAKKAYQNDPGVHIVYGALTAHGNEEVEFTITTDWDPASSLGKLNPDYIHVRSGKLLPQKKIKVPTINLADFCREHDIRKIDLLLTDLQGMDLNVLQTLKEFIQERRIKEIQCEVETDDTPPIHTDLPSNKFADFQALLSDHYDVLWREPEVVPADWWEMDVRWRAKPIRVKASVQPRESAVINLVYEHLKPEQVHAVHCGAVTVIWSPLPLKGCDLYAYLNANSFRGPREGKSVLLMLEPIVVLPGEYNDNIWEHFDHVFTLCDALVSRDRKFTKIPFPRSGWVVPAAITEDREAREQQYPLEGRANAICMINGNKQSFIAGELYSKRIEAAQWFSGHSDIPFDVFGNPPFPLPNYKGALAPDAKLSTLSKYRYCLCFENTNHPMFSAGYITEKILDCFEARTIPLYLGSINIDNYIPRECFIDLRDFRAYEDVDAFLHAMDAERYDRIIERIDAWVAEGGLRPYSWFTLYDQLTKLLPAPVVEITDSSSAGTPRWQPGPAAASKDREWVPVAAEPLWSWQSLARGTSPLLAEQGTTTARSGGKHHASNSRVPFVLTLQDIKSNAGSLRQDFLRDLSRAFDLDVFIETGTYQGDTSLAASHVFAEVHTIELSQNLYEAAKKRFENHPGIHVYQGDSTQVFPRILNTMSGNILFWLDGHYSEGLTAKGDENTPVIQELKKIRDAGTTNAVILIDDLRMFDRVWDHIPASSGAIGYPSLVAVQQAIYAIDRSYRIVVVGDVLMAFPPRSSFDVSPVVASCTISRLYDGNKDDLQKVIEAETVIRNAPTEERVALQALCSRFQSSEHYGFCRHYRLWYALTLMAERLHARACVELLIAGGLGLEHWRANWYLAQAAYEAGYFSLADRSLAAVLLAVPDHAAARELRSRLEQARSEGRPENRFSAQDHLTLAAHLHGAGKVNEAIIEIEATLAEGNAGVDVHLLYAKMLADAGRKDDALTQLHHCLKLAPASTYVQNELGAHYYQQGEMAKAEEHLKTAVTLDSRNYLALKNLLTVLMQTKQYQEAGRVLKELLERAPNDGQIATIAQQTLSTINNAMATLPPADTKGSPMPDKSADPKQRAAEYYRTVLAHYQAASSGVDKFIHPVWKNQLATLGAMIKNGLPDNFLLHPICLEMFVRVGWREPQEYELAYLKKLDKKFQKKLFSLQESPIGAIPRDCKDHAISVNTLGMLWYYARIHENLVKAPSSVIEFGGGFGSLARVFKTLGKPDLTYTIIDLPEMLALQHYYLSGTLGRDRVAAHVRPDEERVQGKINLYPVYGIESLEMTSDLFISTFALSETPEFMQDLVCRSKNFFNAPALYITGQQVTERTELGWQPPHTIVESAKSSRAVVQANRFHIGNNYELMASHKGNRPAPAGLRTTEVNARSNGNRETVTGAIFSKDRAMQLHGTLNTFFLRCKDPERIALKVLYTTSGPLHEGQYAKLKQEFPHVTFIRETSFKNDLLAALAPADYVLFLVDDNLFVRDFNIADAIQGLKDHTDAIGVSLRLGGNTTYCYMLNKPQALPRFQAAGNNIVAYDWTIAELDFGYPLEVSSSLYRLADLFPLLKQIDFRNPNTLELMLETNKAAFKKDRSRLLCFEQSVAFCDPLNMVQTAWVNRAGAKGKYTADTLAQMFGEGARIDAGALFNFTPNACHQEVELKFTGAAATSDRGTDPLVSIMIISYNGIEHIRKCIESIERNTPEPHEIVIIDNARNDGSLEYVKSVPGTIVIANPENIGYSPARAQAMSLVRGEYIVSLDDDTIVTRGWISKFITHAQEHPELGIIGPRSNYVSGPQIVPDARYKDVAELEDFAGTWSKRNRGHLTPACRLVGFCMFINRNVIDRIGCIDPNFGKFFGFDDDDYSFRAQVAGFKIAIADDIFIHHTGGPQGKGNKQYNELMMGAWEMFKKKWKIRQDLPYGSSYPLADILNQPFDKAIHYSALFDRSSLRPIVNPSQASFTDEDALCAEQEHRKADQLADQGDYSGAIVALERLLETYPHSGRLHHELGILRFRTGDKQKALDHYVLACSLEPAKTTYLRSLADLHLSEFGNVEDALVLYIRILNQNPADIEVLLILGNVCYARKHYDDAQNFYQRVLAIDPANSHAREGMEALKVATGAGVVSAPMKQPDDANIGKAEEHAASPRGQQIPEPAARRRAESRPGMTSIIIPVREKDPRLEACLSSLRQHTPEPHELVIVTAVADDQENRAWLKRNIKKNQDLTWIELKPQAGLAACCNAGIQASSGEYLLVLDPQVIVSEGWLFGMLAHLRGPAYTGIVGPLSNGASGPQKIVNAEGTSIAHHGAYTKSFTERYLHRRINVTSLDAFCLLFRYELFEKVGAFDEHLGQVNAVAGDYCVRSILAGFRNLIAGDVLVQSGDVVNDPQAQKELAEKWKRLEVLSPLGEKYRALRAVERAGELFEKDQIDPAIAALMDGIKQASGEKTLYLYLAEILLDSKRYQDALESLTSLPEESKNDIRSLELLGYAQEGLEHYDEARQHADQALELNPRSAPALNLKGILAYKKNDKAAAESFFTKALEIDPGYGEPFTNLGVLKWAADQKDDGLKLLEQGFVLSPTTADIITAYHSAISATENYARSEPLFYDAKALHPHNRRIAFLLIDHLIKQRKYEQAMREIEQALILLGIDDGILSAALELRGKIGPQDNKPASRTTRSLSLCMIVKNEEQYLAKCLMSAKPIASELIVVDTGSTDRTKSIATAFGAKVFDCAWTNDFAEARNVSLSKASGDWIFVLDADEVISARDYPFFLKVLKNADPRSTAYSFNTRNYTNEIGLEGWSRNDDIYAQESAGCGWVPSRKVRLFLRDNAIRFENPVHELVEPSLLEKRIEIKPCDVPIHHYGRLNQEKLNAKHEKYYALGKKKLKEKSNNVKALMELAIQAAELQKHEESIELWNDVLALNPKEPLAYYNMGGSLLFLKRYKEALVMTKKAVELAPSRKEGVTNYAMSELLVGDMNHAEAVLRDLVAKVSDYPIALALLAAADFLKGDNASGRGYFDTLKTMNFNVLPFVHDTATRLIACDRVEYAKKLMDAARACGYTNRELAMLRTSCDQKVAVISP